MQSPSTLKINERIVIPSRYRAIVADVIRLFNTARNHLAGAYWKTGQYVVEIEQGGDHRAHYGSRILANFSAELTENLGSGFSVESLRRMRRFYLENRKSSPAPELPWAHHMEIMKVTDKRRRRGLMQKAVREGLTRDDVRALVHHEAVRAQVEQNLKQRATGEDSRGSWDVDLLKVPKLGPMDTYAIVDPKEVAWPEEDVLLFDHGFKGYNALTPAEARGLKAGDIVTWTGAKLLKTRGAAKPGYTYKAFLEEVIDGDTFWVALGTGLRGISKQKLRLRGIDCPEIDTVEGKLAKQFVEKVLKGVPSLTVLSSKNPSFDRYEADVFLPAQNIQVPAGGTGAKGDQCSSDKEIKEIYLNNLLLEKGYAVKVRS